MLLIYLKKNFFCPSDPNRCSNEWQNPSTIRQWTRVKEQNSRIREERNGVFRNVNSSWWYVGGDGGGIQEEDRRISSNRDAVEWKGRFLVDFFKIEK